MGLKKFFRSGVEVSKEAFKGFSDHKLTKLSGSLAYITLFSMAPLLVVLISLGGIFLEQEAIQGNIYKTLSGFMGADSAEQLQEIVKNVANKGKGVLAAIIGAIVLLFSATAIFGEIQDSINTVWGLKAKPKRAWLIVLKNRLISFSLIISLGFLLLVSLALTTLIDGFSDRLHQLFPDITVVLIYIVNQVLTFFLGTLIFAVIFKVLPDAIIRWRDVWGGAMITALLFMIGKLGISLYVSKASVGTTYGAAGSLVIFLVWTYFSSLILYIGAEYTKVLAVRYGAAIHPKKYAVSTQQVVVERGREAVKV